jgi:hypothetical protein
MPELEQEPVVKLTKKRQLELAKEAKHSYISKLLKAAAIIDIHVAIREGNVDTAWKDVVYTARFNKTIKRWNGSRLAATHKAMNRWSNKLEDISDTLSTHCMDSTRSHIVNTYNDRSLKKVDDPILEYKMEREPSEDDIAWAKYTIDDIKSIDIKNLHVGEKCYTIDFEVVTKATCSKTLYGVTIEEAKAKAETLASKGVKVYDYRTDDDEIQTRSLTMSDTKDLPITITSIKEGKPYKFRRY